MQNQNIHVSRPTRKQRRITNACDFCHRRGLKCKPTQNSHSSSGGTQDEGLSCLTCLEYGQQCTRLRQPKKRGTKPRQQSHDERRHPVKSSQPWLQFELADQATIKSRKVITALIDIYLDTIHPIFPLFCERELWVGWREGTFPSGESDYMSLIAMCALSAQHTRNGALFNEDVPRSQYARYAQDYLSEAIELTPIDLSDSIDINALRAYGFLALFGTQTGFTNLAHKYLGLYHGVVARHGFQDETRWPTELTECDKEVWRRIFWIFYRLEIHTACVQGHMIRTPENQSFVGYPLGLHHPAFIPGRDGNFEDWFSGWNSTTDLYRILEHAIVNFRTNRLARRRAVPPNRDSPPSKSASILEQVAELESKLLPQFNGTAAFFRSSDSGRNRCGFQTTTIFCTIHLIRMVTIVSEETSLKDACQTAQNLIDSMQTISPDYVRAIGGPLLQELSGVGHMLSSIASTSLSSQDYHRLKTVLLSMSDFLHSLKDYNSSAEQAATRLRAHVDRLDQDRLALGCDETISKLDDQMESPPSTILKDCHPEWQNVHPWSLELGDPFFSGDDFQATFLAGFLGNIPWPSR